MAASDGYRKEPVSEQAVANMYAAMRSKLNQISSKFTELEMEVSEHSLVMNAIQPLDQSRRCYRMIGGVLVERTIREVLPVVQRNKEGLEVVVARYDTWYNTRRTRHLTNRLPLNLSNLFSHSTQQVPSTSLLFLRSLLQHFLDFRTQLKQIDLVWDKIGFQGRNFIVIVPLSIEESAYPYFPVPGVD